MKADKGNATVIMDKEVYHSKMLDHLNSSGSYRIINKDPGNKIMCDVTRIIKSLSLDDIIKKKVTPNSAIMPRIYGSPKIHKEGVLLRPIVNTIGSSTYHLAKFLAKKIRPLSSNTSSYVEDSSSFGQWIKDQEI